MALLEDINSSGALFLVHTELAGVVTLRFSVGGTFTQPRHVTAAWKAISAAADELLR